MKQLIMLIIIPLVSYSMEKNLKYFEMLPNEVTELIIALIPEASNANTLAQSARAIAPLSLVNKPMARVTLEILQRYKNQNDYVDLFLSNAQKFENVIFDLPKELTLNTDICTLRTISQRLQKDQTIIPGIRDVFKTCNKFEADDLEQCLQANKKEADALLIEKFNDLDTYENYTRAACQRTYDEVTISDMIVLLKNGADPNQMTVSSFGEQIPLLHQICVLGNKYLLKLYWTMELTLIVKALFLIGMHWNGSLCLCLLKHHKTKLKKWTY